MPKFLIKCTEKVHYSIRVEAPSKQAAEAFYLNTSLERFESHCEAEYDLTSITECNDATRNPQVTVNANGIEVSSFR